MEKEAQLSCGTAVLLIGCVVVIAVLALNEAELADWAAWVQALGSIGAIWWAYRAGELQFRREHERRLEDQVLAARVAEQERLEQLEVLRAVAVDSLEALIEFQNYAEVLGAGKFNLATGRLQDAQYALRGLMVRSLPQGTVTPLLDLQRAVSRTLRDGEFYYGKIVALDATTLDILYGRCVRAEKDANKLPEFAAEWRARQAESMIPSALSPRPG